MIAGMDAAAPTVRLAQPADAEHVAALLVAFRDHMGRDWPPEVAFRANVEKLMQGGDTEYLLAAESGGPPAGVCQLRFRHGVWLDAADCLLEDLFVRAEARGRGLGAALVSAAIDRARARDCGRIELDVNTANAGARRLYEAFGFLSGAERGGAPDLFMRLRLKPDPPRPTA